jgi:hypothetical protein
MSIHHAKEVPQVTWQYWGIYEFMTANPGLYGMDDQRSKCHDNLCKHYKITKEKSLIVTGNMHQYSDAVDLHDALIEVKKDTQNKLLKAPFF